MGWSALSYLIAGIGVWGGVGWLVDEWLDLQKHYGVLVGMLVGATAAIYLVVKRSGA